MTLKILIRNYRTEDIQALANSYYHTIHQINTQHYTNAQVNAWAPASSLETEGWAKKFPKTKPIVASVGNEIVGFAEFEPNGHIDCFYSSLENVIEFEPLLYHLKLQRSLRNRSPSLPSSGK